MRERCFAQNHTNMMYGRNVISPASFSPSINWNAGVTSPATGAHGIALLQGTIVYSSNLRTAQLVPDPKRQEHGIVRVSGDLPPS